jgi:uncharacterized protein YjiS (DUF1127 family)
MYEAIMHTFSATALPAADASSSFGSIGRSHAVRHSNTAAPTSAASNDCRIGPADSSAGALDAWARHAAASNGFADVDAGSLTPSHQSTLELDAAAREFRAASLRAILAAIGASLLAQFKPLYSSWQRYQLAAATHRALSQLDARTLHDIGLDRSELHSIARELTGEIDRTRAHSLMTLRAYSY